MRKWLSLEFPYGSEFPWDSTGHEEIHTWLVRHGELQAANRTVQAVLAYSSVIPHWAYCGSYAAQRPPPPPRSVPHPTPLA